MQLKHITTAKQCVACIVTPTPPSVPISPVIKSLHWLPIRLRIDYKIPRITFETLNGSGPENKRET